MMAYFKYSLPSSASVIGKPRKEVLPSVLINSMAPVVDLSHWSFLAKPIIKAIEIRAMTQGVMTGMSKAWLNACCGRWVRIVAGSMMFMTNLLSFKLMFSVESMLCWVMNPKLRKAKIIIN